MNQLISRITLASVVLASALVSSAPVAQTQPASGGSYAIIFSESKDGFASRTNQNSSKYWQAWTSYIGEMQQAGKVESGSALTGPETGIKIDSKGTHSIDSSRPSLSGYLVIKADSMASAKAFALKSPAIGQGGTVEVRPLLPMEVKP